MANTEFNVNGIDVRYKKIYKDDYISQPIWRDM